MHRIGDGLFTSAGLVGAAMYSACWRVHMTAVVHLGGRVAGSACSALRSERPFNLTSLQHQAILLFRRLGLDEPHVRPVDR